MGELSSNVVDVVVVSSLESRAAIRWGNGLDLEVQDKVLNSFIRATSKLRC